MTAELAVIDWMQALAEITRARLLRLLERSELTVAELCAVLQAPQSTVSRHLRVLADDGWVSSRREATSRLYRMLLDDLDPAQRRLWRLVREQSSLHRTVQVDDQRLDQVLAERQSRSHAFFSSSAGQWDRLRDELFGGRLDEWVLAALADPQAVVGDLGCGTAKLAERLAPFVARVIAVDRSPEMLDAGRRRLKAVANVELRSGDLMSLPIEAGVLDIAIMTLALPYVPRPERVLAEAIRALKPGGRLLVVDLQPHDREPYREEMGHLWLGFDRPQVLSWLDDCGMSAARWTAIPPDAGAKGPPLFAVLATKPRE